MARNKHNKEEREFHLSEVARMYLSGMPKHAIAVERKVHRTQIGYDMRILMKRWAESAMVDFAAMRGQQLERLDMMEDELWRAWHASKADATDEYAERTERPSGQTTVMGAGGQQVAIPVPQESTKTSRRVKKRTGNPDYMTLILQCAQERSKLLGLYPKDKSDAETMGHGIPVAVLQMIMQQVDAEDAAGAFDDDADDLNDPNVIDVLPGHLKGLQA